MYSWIHPSLLVDSECCFHQGSLWSLHPSTAQMNMALYEANLSVDAKVFWYSVDLKHVAESQYRLESQSASTAIYSA